MTGEQGVTPTFFLAGCQKSGTTWMHRCFREHPEVRVPESDNINYLTLYYHRGAEWYGRAFPEDHGEREVGDTTACYLRNSLARERMANLNPSAKILVIVRNPIDRAFSHYWHEKKKRTINWTFFDALGNNIDIYESWIGAGFYYHQIIELMRFFPRKQICVLVYEDLADDPQSFCRTAFEFLGVDADFKPSVLEKKVNRAWYRPQTGEMVRNVLSGRKPRESEYDRGVDPEFREELNRVFQPHNQELARFLGRDLSFWR